MSTLNAQAVRQTELRQRALARLGGRATGATPAQSLAVLHSLASSPATADDALVLLHELQVHQVEIDMQNEEVRASYDEMDAGLRRMSELYERAPVAYLTVDAGLSLVEINAAGARLLGRTAAELRGGSLANLLPETSVTALRSLLERAGGSPAGAQGALTLGAARGAASVVQAVAVPDTVAGRCLLALMPPADGAAAAASDTKSPRP
jgi:PAS domain-containing protein